MNTTPRSTLRMLDQLDAAHLAGHAVILRGNTADVFVAPDGAPLRLNHLIAMWTAQSGRTTVTYSPGSGGRQISYPGQVPAPFTFPSVQDAPTEALTTLLGQIRRSTLPIQFVIDWADVLLTEPGGLEQGQTMEMLSEFVADPAVEASGHRLIVIEKAGTVDPRLGRLPGFVECVVTLPDATERLMFIQRLTKPRIGPPLQLATGTTPEQVAALAGGLMLDDILRVRAYLQGERPLETSWIQTTKAAALRRLAGTNLTVYARGDGLAGVAGLPQLRRLLSEAQRDPALFPSQILLAGPPGVGKTLVVTAIADELGVPAVALGTFRSPWVGQTEQNLRQVLEILRTLAPCVVHIDEIDQAIGPRGTGQSADGGTSERVLAELMTFLGDRSRPERIIVVATSNRPDLLDPAMFDRFEMVPVLHPAPVEAAGIIAIAAKRLGCNVSPADAQAAVERHDQLVTGRLLISVTERARTLARLAGHATTIERKDLDAAFDDLLMALDGPAHEYLALMAIQNATFRSFLPWEAARAIGEDVHIPAYVGSLIDPTTGRVDADRLRARLHQLRGNSDR